MAAGWALDLGTTNTGLARWDDEADRPRLVELQTICRKLGPVDPLEAPRLVPSATHALPSPGFWGKLARWPLLRDHVFWGQHAIIGRRALEMNEGSQHPAFVPSFKGFLGAQALRTVARVGHRQISAREAAWMFVRELLAAVKQELGERPRDVVLTAPVEAYDAYRAELKRIFDSLGVRRLRFLDEPVAAAVGYGLDAERSRSVLVVDFGGGTLDLALVNLSARGVEQGACTVIAKEGRAVGGNLIDRWLLVELCRRLDVRVPADGDDELARLWRRLMLAETRRVKESLFFDEQATFELAPSDEIRRFEARARGAPPLLEVSRDDVLAVLTERGLYDELERCLEGIFAQAEARGVGADDVSDVLMVGGSTLLPQIYPLFEARFGRDRVRAWQPFEAVAFGASAYASGHFATRDFIVHDYAFVTYDPKTHEPEYTVIIPRGTHFPTAPDLWKRQLVPTCSLGEPERIFKLVVCEIGNPAEGERHFSWDRDGQVHKIGGARAGGAEPIVVPLNDANPTLGALRPPHAPGDRRPRLEIAFGVDANRWLCATVRDLRSSRFLLKGDPVVRLL